jgi:hypothetical protein
MWLESFKSFKGGGKSIAVKVVCCIGGETAVGNNKVRSEW